jgi:hypothetical protein
MNIEEAGEPYLWLADTHDTLSDWDPTRPVKGTSGPVDASWRSPFIGASVQEITAFIEATPKPPKPLCQRFFAVLQKEQYERSKQVLIYKIPDDCEDTSLGRSLQAVPCPVHLAGFFFVAFDRSDWDTAVEQQALYYGDGADWEDDDPYTQVMALFVLDDFPTEVRHSFVHVRVQLILSPDHEPSTRRQH